MKLLDGSFDRFFRPFKTLVDTVTLTAKSVSTLASRITVLAHNQVLHSHVINQLWNNQQDILEALKKGNLDTSLPDIAEAPADDKAQNKPN